MKETLIISSLAEQMQEILRQRILQAEGLGAVPRHDCESNRMLKPRGVLTPRNRVRSRGGHGSEMGLGAQSTEDTADA